MKLSEVAKLSVKDESEMYESMAGCDLLSRMQEQVIKDQSLMVNTNIKGIGHYEQRSRHKAIKMHLSPSRD